MADEVSKAIDGLFAQHNAAADDAQKRQQAILDEETAFVRQFVELRDSVVRPALEVIETAIKANGKDAVMVVTEEHFHATNRRWIPASISLRFGNNASAGRGGTSQPHFMVASDRYGRTAKISVATRSSITADTNHKLSAVSQPLINDMAVEWLRRVLGVGE